jgi:hypothetical protein
MNTGILEVDLNIKTQLAAGTNKLRVKHIIVLQLHLHSAVANCQKNESLVIR